MISNFSKADEDRRQTIHVEVHFYAMQMGPKTPSSFDVYFVLGKN